LINKRIKILHYKKRYNGYYKGVNSKYKLNLLL
jgi:hypothetical protein